ncbi:Ger(x)C family spore germination protein [Lysinibacillus sp. BW-2-10]|uniref:Ger(x)C family spore germination protein n=1 Tax=Lysinibacillus sp. BW-2-10 TaxID=2590030 RepID=UPI00117D559B|nr:Ger(x)C family spore germination protein [Lysinibacillus sp. BW-2-10]TSI07921.1 Ger(x)C family spore germination protein [Lysinibacillus sp. BW-2-10]
MKHAMKCLVLVGLVFLMAGCWDRLEIEERAMVLGLSIDLQEKESSDDPINHPDVDDMPTSEIGMVKITAQLAVPGQIPLGPSQGGGSKSKDTVLVVAAVGHTMDDAMSNLQQQLGSTLFLGQLKIIILSREVAEKGIREISDFIKRHPEIRRDTWLLVNGKKAEETLRVAPKLERVPTLYLSGMLDNAIKMGKFPKDKIGQFWSNLESNGQDGYLPFITVKDEEHIQISGLAYFRGMKMVGHIEPYQIAYFNGITEQNPGGSKALVKLSENESVMLQSTYRKSNIHVSLKDGRPHVQVKLKVIGNIVEKQNVAVDTHDAIKKIEKSAEELIEEQYEVLIKETQEKKSDIFGFGEYVRGDLRTYWDQHIETAEKWREAYQELAVDVVAEVEIKEVGLRSK